MQKTLLLLMLMIFATLKVSAYEYQISADNKYHTEPLMLANNDIDKPSELARISSFILRPVGLVVGGLIVGLADGIRESVDQDS